MGKGLHRERGGRGASPIPEFGVRLASAEVQRERDKARELRASQWWKNQIAAGVCHYCGRHFEPGELTMDHVVPVARGGKSDRHNVVPCCKECNSRKKYLTPAEQILDSLGLDQGDLNNEHPD